MKKQRSAGTRLFSLLLVSFTLLSITAAAAGTAGSSSDPLVTLSYLNETFLPELMSKVDEKLAAHQSSAAKELEEQVAADVKALEKKYGAQSSGAAGESGAAESFTVVTVPSGKTLYGALGCEVMLRVGAATVVSPSSPGLIDSTDGTTLESGKALAKNHLYLMTIEGRGVKGGSGTTKLLVRGAYEIK